MDRPGHGGAHPRLGPALHRGHAPRVPARRAARDRILIYPAPFVRRGDAGEILEVRAGGAGRAEDEHRARRGLAGLDRSGSRSCEREVRRRLQDVVLATDDFQAMPRAGGRRRRRAGQAGRAAPGRAPRSSPRSRSSCAGSATARFVFLGYRAYDIVEARGRASRRGRAGLGARHPARRGASRPSRRRVPLDEPATPALRALRPGRPDADHQQDQRRGHRAPPRAHGLHRGEEAGRGRAAWSASTASSGSSPRSAYAEDAEDIPILRGKLAGRSSTEPRRAPGIARLQGDHHDLQLDAEGGAVPRLDRADRGRRPHRAHLLPHGRGARLPARGRAAAAASR